MSETEQNLVPKGRREKKDPHWIVADLFAMAKEQSLSFQQLEDRVLEQTGQRISKDTLKYWANGYSTPKVDEVEAIASTLGYELDLLRKDDAKPKT
jgi:transcriptional regulator with XRE-family HTH domain